jgi:hypothetical protein
VINKLENYPETIIKINAVTKYEENPINKY